ncbi:MAG: divergent PAP2 family protein [Lachnospiraceae bacterium]
MQFLIDLFTNRIFLSTAISWLIAQTAKVIIAYCKKEFAAERLVGGGGMPSSHSATVTALCVSTAHFYGGGSFEFVMALFFAFIVIYDALGVRLETEREAQILNRLRERDIAEGKEPLYHRPLREKLGHNLAEIAGGMLVGIACALIICNCFPVA